MKNLRVSGQETQRLRLVHLSHGSHSDGRLLGVVYPVLSIQPRHVKRLPRDLFDLFPMLAQHRPHPVVERLSARPRTKATDNDAKRNVITLRNVMNGGSDSPAP